MADYRGMGIGRETALGTTVAVTSWLNYIKSGIKHSRGGNYIVTVGYMEPLTHSAGKFKAEGPIEALTVPQEIGYLINSLFGTDNYAVAAGGGAGGFIHSWEPGPTKAFYSARLNKDAYSLYYASMMCNKWTLKLAPALDCYSTFDVFSQKAIRAGASTAPSFTTVPQSFHGADWVTTIGGVGNTDIMAMEYVFECAQDKDDYRRDSIFIQNAHRGEFRTKLNMDIYFVNQDEFERFCDGTLTHGTYTDPATEITPFNITSTLTGADINGTDNYKLVITTPKMTWDTEEAAVDRRERIVRNLTAEAVYDFTQGSACKVDLTNSVGDYNP